jgi:hypothetical protein
MASTVGGRPIDTICLDAGGTLVWPNWERVRDASSSDRRTRDCHRIRSIAELPRLLEML